MDETRGQIRVALGDVASEAVEQSGPDGEFIYVDISSVDRESKKIVAAKRLTKAEAPSRAKQVLHAGDVLVSMTRPNLNAVALVPQSLHGAIASSGFHVLRSKHMKPAFLFYLVQTEEFIRAMCDQVQGALYPAVRPKDIHAFPLRLESPAQQTRIVEKLEELLCGLDTGVAELKAGQHKLARYRQSLLKAAVQGELTAAWRERNPPQETGAQLLARILAERRTRWEARQRARFAQQAKALPKNWQNKYPEPVQPDTAGLPDLPQGWVWASLEALIADGPQNGLYLPRSSYGRGVPILRIDDYQIGWHRPRAELNLVDADAGMRAAYMLRRGDLVINRVNSMTHLGKVLHITELLEGAVFESNMMRLNLSESVDPCWVTFYLGSDIGRSCLIRDAKWAVNQASINQQDVQRTLIPLPPPKEQREIVRILKLQHEAADEQVRAIEHALRQSTAQRQNILRAAFTGQLVPQDPTDEPASALLARIRAERAARGDGKKKPRGRRAKGAG